MLTPHMTRPQGDALADQQEATAPGMAFWAGPGPEGEQCRTCENWGRSKGFKRDEEGFLRNRRCVQFSRMSQGRAGPGVPSAYAACKYFTKREKAPAEHKPRAEA